MKRLQMFSIISILCIFTAYLALSVNVKPGEAQFFPTTTQHYSCRTAFITVSPNGESPSCPTGTSSSPDLSHYTSTITVTIKGTGHYKLFWGAAAFWCQHPNTPSCHDVLSGTTASNMDVNLDNGSQTINVPVTGVSSTGTACGNFQNDFGIYLADEQGNRITDAGCPIAFTGNVSVLWQNNNMASFCNSSLTCVSPTPTAMPSPVNTPTPTQIPLPTSTVAPTVTPVPTITVALTQTPAPTGAPTPMSTPVPSETQVPTVTPTPTSVPVSTPIPTTTPTSSSTNTNNNNNTQSQSQTQNNNQSVNVTLASTASSQQVLASTTSTPSQLPSTGVPIQNVAFLISLLPVGLKLRKWS